MTLQVVNDFNHGNWRARIVLGFEGGDDILTNKLRSVDWNCAKNIRHELVAFIKVEGTLVLSIVLVPLGLDSL